MCVHLVIRLSTSTFSEFFSVLNKFLRSQQILTLNTLQHIYVKTLTLQGQNVVKAQTKIRLTVIIHAMYFMAEYHLERKGGRCVCVWGGGGLEEDAE